jgi:hypothetical protein
MELQGLEILVGIILPPFIDLVNRYVKNGNWRYVASLVVSLVVGGLLSLNELSLQNVLESGAIVFAAAQTVYKTYYASSGVRERLYGKSIAK